MPHPEGFTDEFYRTIKEEVRPLLYSVFQKTEEGIPPNSLYEANITLIQKLDEDITKKENYRLIEILNIDRKILNEVLAHQIQPCIKRLT